MRAILKSGRLCIAVAGYSFQQECSRTRSWTSYPVVASLLMIDIYHDVYLKVAHPSCVIKYNICLSVNTSYLQKGQGYMFRL